MLAHTKERVVPFMYLIDPNKKQFKANLHSHSVLSDGMLTPEEMKERYKRNGYSILAVTDHEVPRKHPELNDEEFLTITGYEGYIRQYPDARSDPYAREIHMCLFARDPDNETMICYNPGYCRYLSEEEQAALKKAGSQRPREYSREYINEYIRTARENGYIVTYNHPFWSMESEADIMAYEGYFSLEIHNTACGITSRLEKNTQLYEQMLMSGKRVFCHSSDDNHNEVPEGHPADESCKSFTMILADGLEYGAIFTAMETGEMYSSTGPAFKEISIEDNKLHIECSEVEQICLLTGGKNHKAVYAEKGGVITSADFEVDRRARYIHVLAYDKNGGVAESRGYMRYELPF